MPLFLVAVEVGAIECELSHAAHGDSGWVSDVVCYELGI
jgi:hypothetical protein